MDRLKSPVHESFWTTSHSCVRCEDFLPILTEFVRQARDRTDVLYEAREREFIAKLNPQTFESRHTWD